MSMAIIDNGPTINETQLHAMLTGNIKGATQLEGWEAFKNFFIKLLNNLPGVNLEDKEKSLREIYEKIYPQENTAVSSEQTHEIETIWHALQNLIELMEGDNVRTMTFDFGYRDSSLDIKHQPYEMNFNIVVDDHLLPDISYANTPLNNVILSYIIDRYMLMKVDEDGQSHSGVYQLNPAILTANGNRVSFDAQTQIDSKYDFMVATAIDQNRAMTEHGINENGDLDEQAHQLDQYQQKMAHLQSLISPPGTSYTPNDIRIKAAIDQLSERIDEQQNTYKSINQASLTTLIEKYSLQTGDNLVIEMPDLDLDITHLAKMNEAKYQSVVPEGNQKTISEIRQQLEHLVLITELQKKIHDSAKFPEELYQRVNEQRNKLDEAGANQLMAVRDRLLENIREANPCSVGSTNLKSDLQHQAEKVISTLTHYEEDIKQLLENSDLRPSTDLASLKQFFSKANHLLPIVENRNEIIERAGAAYRILSSINELDKYLDEGSKIGDLDISSFPLKGIAQQQQLIDNLPVSQRKSDYQTKIDALNLNIIYRQVEIWAQCLSKAPETETNNETTFIASTHDNIQSPLLLAQAESKVMELKQELETKKNLTENEITLIDRINTLTEQSDVIALIEKRLYDFESTNTHAAHEDIDALTSQNNSLLPGARRDDYEQRIKTLAEKSLAVHAISEELNQLTIIISGINRYHIAYSADVGQRFAQLEERSETLSKNPANKHLLTNIGATKEVLTKIQNQDQKFTQVQDTLAQVAKAGTNLSNPLWHKGLLELGIAARELEQLHESPRTNDVAKRTGHSALNALEILEDIISQCPEDKKLKRDYMSEAEENYISLRDIIRTLGRKLPNIDILEEKIKKIKHENKFKSTNFVTKLDNFIGR
ncbi:hypothetical protein AU512_05900 [Lonsdalea iberica]|uniref:Uncharacterized protein n=1 Tax=Lonsdalea iberica TaxID=1082703 RepID=A0ABX3XH48_9GAMM|nr:hypothetical protein [Lonsdalea iberica]OSN10919.1 hypothetical protein AU512_05900 [Lonsdalea iberica]